jgi:hypothetical protein
MRIDWAKIKATGHENGKYVQTDDGNWHEIDTDGSIVRKIKKRRFVEHDGQGNIIGVHNIDFSQYLEEDPNATLSDDMVEIKDTDPEFSIDALKLIKNHRVEMGKIKKRSIQ